MVKAKCVLLGLSALGTALGAVATNFAMNDAGIFPQKETVALLRARGQEGLDEALRSYDRVAAERDRLQEEANRLSATVVERFVGKSGRRADPLAAVTTRLADAQRQLDEMQNAIDAIGGQRSCTVSRLYWYTDLNEAKAAAERTGRPILSLRMLGKLTDEYSCANSRFFRTALYSNKEISDYLRGNYVLHWQSVRPVPRVTIDFGDGRKLQRTLTGNSAHYVVTSKGTPLDALPGLYGPQAFLAWLERLYELHGRYVASDESQRSATLAEFHRKRRQAVFSQWARDIRQLGESELARVESRINAAIEFAAKSGSDSPLALAASRMAEAKTAAESPLLRFASFSGPWIENGMDESLWRSIAGLHREKVKLDAPSIELMRREFPNAAQAGRISFSKMRQEDPVLRMVRLFEDSMTLDTVRNEYLLHRRIHEQFADASAATADFDALNEWVYAELFLTPSSDPWLGLAPPDVYTALENDGRVEPVTARFGRNGG